MAFWPQWYVQLFQFITLDKKFWACVAPAAVLTAVHPLLLRFLYIVFGETTLQQNVDAQLTVLPPHNSFNHCRNNSSRERDGAGKMLNRSCDPPDQWRGPSRPAKRKHEAEGLMVLERYDCSLPCRVHLRCISVSLLSSYIQNHTCETSRSCHASTDLLKVRS